MRSRNWTIPLLLAAFAAPAAAQDDPCSFSGTVHGYIQELSTRISNDFNNPPVLDSEEVGAETVDELAERATGDGLTGGRLDLVRRAFVALDLGEVTEEDDRVVFNFNPTNDAIGLFAPRLIVHQPTLFGALGEHVDALDDGETIRKSLEDGLGELSDAEVRVRWTPPGDAPEARINTLTPVAQDVFNAVWKRSGGPGERARQIANESAAFNLAVANSIAAEKARDDSRFAAGILAQMKDVCGGLPRTTVLIRDYSGRLRAQGVELLGGLRDSLQEAGFFALADVLETEPQWSFEGSYRQRDGAVGPDELSLNFSIRTGMPWLKGMTRESKLLAMSDDEALKLAEELEESSLPTFALKFGYSRIEKFSIGIPAQPAPFEVEGAWLASGSVEAGGFINKARQRRWELKASYDNASDDPTRQDRFVGTLSWVEKLPAELVDLAGGSELVVSLVYANKPEFRGEVDEDFGMRAGLKWSLGD